MTARQYRNVGPEFEEILEGKPGMEFESLEDVIAAHESRMWRLNVEHGDQSFTSPEYQKEAKRIYQALQAYSRKILEALRAEAPLKIEVKYNP